MSTEPQTAEDYEKLLASFDSDGASDPAEETAPEAETSAAEPDAANTTETAAEPESPKSYVLDDPSLPEEWRGKSQKELLEDRLKYTHQAHRAGQEKNELERRLIAAEAALRVREQLQQQQTQATPQKPKTIAERAGVDFERNFIQDPSGTLEKTLDVYGNEIKQEVTEKLSSKISELEQQLLERERREFIREGERVWAQGRPETVPLEKWKAATKNMAAYIERSGLDGFNPASWSTAWEETAREAREVYGVPVATAPATPPPAVPNPPGSSSKTAAIPSASPARQLSPKLKAEAEQLAREFGIPYDKLEAEMLNDPKYARR